MAYKCEECGAEFSKLSQLLQHRRTENHWKKHMCILCKKTFNRKDNLEKHMKKHNDQNIHHCTECMKAFQREDAWAKHMEQSHGQRGGGGVNKRSLDDGINEPVTKKNKIGHT